MAKVGSVNRNNRRKALVKKFAGKRARLAAIANNKETPMDEAFAARLKLAALPRNSAPIRVRNRCEVTGRPRGYYRKLRMSRIALRELASAGMIPGMTKSSW
jgi:small subunit ribosomal protein S14